MSNYGFTFNMSATQDENGASAGFHVTDSDGTDISRQAEGTDMSELIKTLGNGVLKEFADGRTKVHQKKLDEAKRERDAKKADLQKQIAELQSQIADLDKDEAKEKVDTKVTKKDQVSDIDSIFDNFFKDYFDFKKFFEN